MIATLVQYYAEQMMAVAMIGMHRQNVAADSLRVSQSPGALQQHALAKQRYQCRYRLMPMVNGFRRVRDGKIRSFARRYLRKSRHDLPARENYFSDVLINRAVATKSFAKIRAGMRIENSF